MQYTITAEHGGTARLVLATAATRAATIGVRVNDGPQETVTVRAANGWAGSTPLDVTLLPGTNRSEEHTSELQSLMRISYAVFCLKKKHSTRDDLTDIYT